MARNKPKSDLDATAPAGDAAPHDDAAYTVVARRYRPQRFEDVVGQEHVVQALRNAIRMNRVTHAYVFSGTRGVGKTSIARIFAKCLNCVDGPTETPCNRCEICQSIASGQDVDVIEIDGASNNGVEQVRELRQNAGLRPTRARFKIYYIDEVHMLSTGAFNALLKTLEEPPEHVKFFFSTTEPNKIPITVLSRCQRFDFAGIAPEQIIESLASICAREGVSADREALQAVARRAGGSMRDAQSLLEQLLSSGEKQLSSTFVHQTLGIAPDEGILDLIDALADRDAARALQLQHRSIHGGVQPGELLSGLIEFLRDVMVVAAGAEVDTLAATPGLRPRLRAVADRWPLDTILAALQILSETRMRMRGSPHGRILLELALCRIARLEDFSDLADLIARVEALDSGTAPAAPAKKKPTEPLIARTPPAASPAAPVSQPASEPAPEPAPVVARPASTPAPAVATPSPAGSSPAPATPPRPARSAATAATRTTAATASRLDLDTVLEAWNDLPGKVGASLGTRISQVRPSAFEPPDRVIVTLTPRQQYVAEACDTPHARSRLEAALGGMLGQPVVLEFVRGEGNLELPAAPSVTAVADRADELATNPFVEQICRLFEARRVRVDFEPET